MSSSGASIASKVDKGSLVINVKDYGAAGDGVTDDTAAITSALAAATPGSTVFFPGTGSGAWYKTGALTVTKPNIRFLGQPRDGYAVSLRPAAAGITILTVKEAGFVLEDMAILGDGGTNGAGATVTGLDLYGSVNADVDCSILGATIQWCLIGARVRGRNAGFRRALLSNNDRAVVIDGLDAYHTGAGASSGNRGNTIENCRFHNTGTAAIDITTTAKVRHMVISGNYTDSNGNGIHVRAAGTAADPHEKITFRDNKHAEVGAVVYALAYVNNSTLDGADIMGNTAFANDANGIELNNCDTIVVRNVFGVQLGGSGLYARNCTHLTLDSIIWRVLGLGTIAGHGFDIDSTNTASDFDNLSVETADGWGFTGSPATSRLGGYSFRACTLGGINSASLNPEQVYLPASAMGAITGAPSLAGVTGVGYPMAWLLDAAVVEQVVGQVNALPNSWETFDAYIVWAATDGTAGNVIWDLNYSFIIAGQLTNNGNASNPGAAQAAPGVAGQVARYKIAAGKSRSTAPMVIRVDRNAASASDTYAADAALIGVQLVRAS